MALNFPNTPADGERWTDPNGRTWIYNASNGWQPAAGSSITHNGLLGRDAADCHPISAISNLDGLLGQYKNKIINGCMRIWQRGTSFNGEILFSADRWLSNRAGTGMTISKNTAATGGIWGGLPALFIDAATGPADATFNNRIEDVNQFKNKTYTFSLVHNAPAGHKLYAKFQRHDTSGVVIDNTGEVHFATGDGTARRDSWTFTLGDLGQRYDPEQNSFGQITLLPIKEAAASFNFNQLQLEEGDQATAFERRHIQQELAMCQRYFYYHAGQNYHFVPQARSTPNANAHLLFGHLVTMRVAPTVTWDASAWGTGITHSAPNSNESWTRIYGTASSGTSSLYIEGLKLDSEL